MMNLLSASCYRMIHGKLCYLLTGGFVVLLGINFWNVRQSYGSISPVLDHHFFSFMNLNLVGMAVFCPLFLGPEYYGGTLRNKLIIGRTRTEIYLANLGIFQLFGGILTTVALIAGICFGIPLLGSFQTAEPKDVLLCSLLAYTTTWTSGAIFALFAILVDNRSISVTLCILLALGMILLGQFLYVELSQPEFQRAVFYTDTGESFVMEQPNLRYLSGWKREVYQLLSDATPGGQSYQIMAMAVYAPLRILGCSVILFVLTTGVGLVLFRRRDVK